MNAALSNRLASASPSEGLSPGRPPLANGAAFHDARGGASRSVGPRAARVRDKSRAARPWVWMRPHRSEGESCDGATAARGRLWETSRHANTSGAGVPVGRDCGNVSAVDSPVPDEGAADHGDQASDEPRDSCWHAAEGTTQRPAHPKVSGAPSPAEISRPSRCRAARPSRPAARHGRRSIA